MQNEQDGIAAAFALLSPKPATAPDAATATDAAPAQPGPDVERLQGELEASRSENAALVERQRRTELKGKVSDVDAAMKLLDPEKHLNSDGSVNLDSLRGQYPSLYIQQMTPTAPDGGGGSYFSSAATSLESAVQSGSAPLINYAFGQELKRS